MTSNRSLFAILRIVILLVFFITILIFLIYPFDDNYFYSKTWPTSLNILSEEAANYTTRSNSKHFNDTYHVRKLRSIPQGPLFFQPDRSKIPSYNKSCAYYSTVYDIEFVNIFWQRLNTSHGNIYFYGAYFDNRNLTLNLKPTFGPAVRILGMIDWDIAYQNMTEYYCQFWFKNEEKPVFSKIIDRKYNWKGNKGLHQPFLYTCKVPYNDQVPTSVSVVLDPCDTATNHLSVQYDKPVEKQDFAVCVKGLAFLKEDISIRLVEWMELMRLLGAEKIFMYEFSVHPNISKVLHYYKSTGYLDVTSLTLPAYFPNDPEMRDVFLKNRIKDKRHNELVPYNDCFYRNLYKYKLIALLDIDEVIVPIGNVSTWKEMILKIGDTNPDTFHNFTTISFTNAYFFDTFRKQREWIDGIPEYMHILQHVYRSRNHSAPGRNPKAFFNTENVLTLHNHIASHCIGNCSRIIVNTSLAHLQHYKTHCPDYLGMKCMEFEKYPVLDTSLWKYSRELISRTTNILEMLRLI